ncbi:protein sidekick-1-like [Montipora capricornis]|uniref:protein sidekick-1-like n=1 Tax=Montipora capricornis TaxID=246305 RepID=UPI0035F188DA
MACTGFFLILAVLLFTTQAVPAVTINGAPEQFIIVGNEIQLTCHYNSTPAASEVQWQKNGLLISRNATMENGARGNITHFNESSIQLTINPSISTDAADYTCFVIKILDNSSDTIAIRVKPDPPKSVIIASKTSRTITISWKSGFDGNSEVSSYTVEISEDNQNFRDGYCQGLSNSSCRVLGLITNATLEGLHPGRLYYVRVFANNKVGQSEASSIVNATTDEEEPNAPPGNFRKFNTTSTSIVLQWDQVEADDQNGVILSYTVTYKALPNGSEKTHKVTAPTTLATLTGLNEYTNYSITVFASTIKGGGPVSQPLIIITDQDEPSAPPTLVQGHNTSSTSIFVSWSEVPESDQNGVILSYTVTYKALPPSPGSKPNKTVNAPTTSITLEDLNEFTDYNITVFASTVKGGGTISAPITVRTAEDTPSAPPVGLKPIDTTSTTILVHWDEVLPSHKNGIITNYTVSYQATSERIVNAPVNTTIVVAPTMQANLTDLIINMKYNISVLASTIKGRGPSSNGIIVSTNQSEPGASPTNVTGHNTSSTTILVEWDEVPIEKQHGEIIGYTVIYWRTNDPKKEKHVQELEATLQGLVKYTDYNIEVLASTIKGRGPPSHLITVRTDQDKPSAPPTSVQGFNTSSTSIFVSWGEVPGPDQNGVILNYTVTYYALPSAPEVTKTVVAPITNITLGDLSEFTDYNITVFASTVKGGGTISAPIIVRTDEDKPSASPTSLQGHNISSTSIFVRWSEVPEADQNGVILSYTVTYKALPSGPEVTKTDVAPITNITLGDLSEFTDYNITLGNLSEFTDYNITVFASTIKGGGNISAPITVRTDEDKPGAPPTNVTGHNTSSTTILVEWDKVSVEKQHGEIIGYTVIYWRTKDAKEEEHVEKLEATLRGLVKYTDYNIEVLASTIKGRGPPSRLITVRTDQDRPTAPPTITDITALNSTSILVKWDPVPEEYRNGIITRYTIHYKDVAKDTESTVDIPAPASEITITGLRQKALYSIRVLAATSKGDGRLSSANEAKTLAIPTVAPPSQDSVGTTEVNIPFKIKETLSSGKPVSYYRVIVVPLKEGADAGNSADSKYETVTLTYQNKEQGKPYTTAEFSNQDAKTSFPVGDGKFYSRDGVTESKRKRREVNAQTKNKNTVLLNVAASEHQGRMNCQENRDRTKYQTGILYGDRSDI